MGGGKGGNFGSTSGSIGESSSQSVLDAISALLSAIAWIPGIDTVADILAIPVDIARDDWISAGLDLLGVIPFVGEIGDVAKAARIADDIADTAKAADKAIDAAKAARKAANFSDFPKTIHAGRQGKHIVGHNNYKKGKSILNISIERAQKLIDQYSGTGKKIGANRETVNFGEVIGKYVDPKTGKSYNTTVGTIHYSKTGTHIVPEKPIDWRG